MNVFDFYKLITDSIPSYLMFVVLMLAMYMLSSIFIAFCTEQIIKIIISIRAPITRQDLESKQQ